MKVAIFHGSPRKGNTYKATEIFLDELQKNADVQCVEFFLPESMPEFCTGCQICFSHSYEKCPHSEYVTKIFDTIIDSEALVFATPHYGASTMTSSMKNLLDHLDFLTFTVTPRRELFTKKAFIITTATGSTAAIKPIKKYLKYWGVNRVYSLGLRMFTDKWSKLTKQKQDKFERKLRKAANRFYSAKTKYPYISAIFMYHMSKFILKKYVGEDAYPYKYWQENGYFKRNPLTKK